MENSSETKGNSQENSTSQNTSAIQTQIRSQTYEDPLIEKLNRRAMIDNYESDSRLPNIAISSELQNYGTSVVSHHNQNYINRNSEEEEIFESDLTGSMLRRLY